MELQRCFLGIVESHQKPDRVLSGAGFSPSTAGRRSQDLPNRLVLNLGQL